MDFTLPGKGDFGFKCGSFSVALSEQKFVIPGGKSAPLRKSYLPYLPIDLAKGPCRFQATHLGKIVCDVPVVVHWVTHPQESEPFIALESETPDDLVAALRPYAGKALDLLFTRVGASPTRFSGMA